MACMIPAIGVRPPLLILVMVRAMAPVAGIPPTSGDTRLAIPWPISSWFELCLSPMIPSATVAESSDSIAPSMAMVMAGDIRLWMVSQVIPGTATSGSSELMLNRSPIVAMLSMPAYFFRRKTMTVISTMAMSEPGIFFENFGVMAMIKILNTPTSVDHQSMVWKLAIYTPHLDMKSPGTLSIVSPNRSFICVVKIVSAIPLVNPTMIG